ncbi:peptidoglycan editing factor PgeF [bacterium]|nr:peptidoglycan editing factor PgeF [bacterium]
MFYFDKINNKKILKSDKIQSINAFFTTRQTVIKSKEDNMQNLVFENKELICQYLGIDIKNFVSPNQTHSANIDVAKIGKSIYPETDALILTEKNLGVFLNFADCTPVILYDKKQNIGAIAHAGWRGTAQKISALTVQKLIRDFNSKPSDITALIGPAIGMCCYNVGEEVYTKLKSTVCDFERLYEIREGNIYVDLKGINKRQLEETGLYDIDVCPYCTVHNNDEFFSYRNENATTSRHSAIICLT